MKTPWRLRDLTLSEIKKKKYEVAVLPLGATEPHNLHLPYATDILEAEAIGELACEAAAKKGAKVVLLPTIPFGSNRSTMAFPLTINLDHSTLSSLIKDIAESMEAHRIHKLVILNGHGGNYIRHILKDMYGRTKVFLTLINWWEVGAPIRSKIFE
ncbi:MAG: creatininase family protein, partial [Bacteroidota bacterium]